MHFRTLISPIINSVSLVKFLSILVCFITHQALITVWPGWAIARVKSGACLKQPGHSWETQPQPCSKAFNTLHHLPEKVWTSLQRAVGYAGDLQHLFSPIPLLLEPSILQSAPLHTHVTWRKVPHLQCTHGIPW